MKEENNYRILIVDDNTVNVRVLANLLKNNNYLIEFALNGDAALKWLESSDFDLILLDINMPGIDGYDVATILKSNPLKMNIPIIFLTANNDEQSIVKAFEAGGVDYLTKPFNHKELIARINTHISLQKAKEVIETQINYITDSIHYSKLIQQALLPNEKYKEFLPHSFVLFKPRDIISGDFYWFKKISDIIYLAVGDCTGHGIPGAMLSVLAISSLNEIVIDKNDSPAKILDKLRDRIKNNLNQDKEQVSNNRDGLDIGIIKLDENQKLEYAGAFNPLFIIRKNELIQYYGDRQPIALYDLEESFTNHEIDIHTDDQIYLFSDGYPDQFGGDKNKKLKYRLFKELLMEVSQLPINEQKNKLESFFVNWKGEQEQTDDVTIVGIKFH